MTEHKHLKNRVRTRMQKTGERYAAALRHVRAHRPEPEESAGTAGLQVAGTSAAPEQVAGTSSEQAAGTSTMPFSDAAIRAATGRGWEGRLAKQVSG